MKKNGEMRRETKNKWGDEMQDQKNGVNRQRQKNGETRRKTKKKMGRQDRRQKQMG